MTAQERFDELISEYLDETLDAEGTSELGTLVATRPEFAARFVLFARLHGGLREMLAPPPAPPAPRRRLPVAAIVAVAVAILLLALLLLRR